MRWLNAVRAQGARRRRRARARAGRARAGRRDAPGQGRARARRHAPRGAHRRAARTAARCSARAPGRIEYEIEAELLHEFRRHGAQFPAYAPIVAGGANACVLHYVANDAPLRDGDLLLIDAGCELDGYASDITRTFPVERPLQRRAARGLRARARRAGAPRSTRCAPAARWNEPHDAAVRVLAQGMIDLKLLAGSAATRCSRRRPTSASTCTAPATGSASTCTTPATTSAPGKWRTLAPGMVLTVEPGSTSAPRTTCRSACATSASASRTTCWSPRRLRGAHRARRRRRSPTSRR